MPDAVHVEPASSTCRISATPFDAPVVSGGRTYSFGSGELRTAPHFVYGDVRIRARLPVARGVWPAIWLVQTGDGPVGEIDIVEMVGAHPGRLHHTFVWSYEPKQHHQQQVEAPDDPGGWHDYGVRWSPEGLEWRYDGRVTATFSADDARAAGTAIPSTPHVLILNVAVGGERCWAGVPDATTAWPAVMEVASVVVDGV